MHRARLIWAPSATQLHVQASAQLTCTTNNVVTPTVDPSDGKPGSCISCTSWGDCCRAIAFCQVHLALQCVPGWRTTDTNAGEVLAAPVLANLTVNLSAPTWMSAEPFHRNSKCTIFRTFRELKLAGSFPARFLTSFHPAATVHGADASASAGSSNIGF